MSTMTVLDSAGSPQTVEKPLTPGQALMAASRPIVIASDQSAIPVSGTITANVGTGTRPISAASLPLPTGAATSANQSSVITSVGAPADAAWTTGNGSQIALLKAIATNAISTAPSPVELGPFTIKQVAASQTTAVLGATGAVGDYLYGIHIQPATTSPGSVTVFDGTSTTVYSFPGGASSVGSLAPIGLQLCAKCLNAGWHITTGANVSVTALGTFT